MLRYKDLTRKEKIEYIWAYYKLHIMGGIIVLFFVITMINRIFIHKPVKVAANIGIIGKYLISDDMEGFEQKATEGVIAQGDDAGVIQVDFFTADQKNQPYMTLGSIQRFMGLVSNGEIDIVVTDTEQFTQLAKDHAFMRLDTVLEEDKMEHLEQRWVQIQGKEDSREYIYGVRLNEISPLTVLVDPSDQMIGFMANSKRKEKAVILLQWLLGLE